MRVRLDGAREADDGQHFYLLGLIRGHWRQSAEADFAADSVDEAEFQHLNTGIAIVTPIEELLPIFETERFVQYRAEMERRLDARSPGLQPSE
jgi:hypothetical protein